jgi:hypothetical protein
MLCFGNAHYITPCESIKLRNMLLITLADCPSLLKLGTASDSYVVEIKSCVLSVLSSEGCMAFLDEFDPLWD